jgi:hypothetical protein
VNQKIKILKSLITAGLVVFIQLCFKPSMAQTVTPTITTPIIAIGSPVPTETAVSTESPSLPPLIEKLNMQPVTEWNKTYRDCPPEKGAPYSSQTYFEGPYVIKVHTETDEGTGHPVSSSVTFYEGKKKLWTDSSEYAFEAPTIIFPEGKSFFNLDFVGPEEMKAYDKIGIVLAHIQGGCLVSNRGHFIAYASEANEDYSPNGYTLVIAHVNGGLVKKIKLDNFNNVEALSDDGNFILVQKRIFSKDPNPTTTYNYVLMTTDGKEVWHRENGPQSVFLDGLAKYVLWIDRDKRMVDYLDFLTGQQIVEVPIPSTVPIPKPYSAENPSFPLEMTVLENGGVLVMPIYPESKNRWGTQYYAFNIKGEVLWSIACEHSDKDFENSPLNKALAIGEDILGIYSGKVSAAYKLLPVQ